MSFIPQSFINELVERIDIVDLIDSRVKLKKTGKDYAACCPFHDEKTPSFTVSRDKQFFHCFGCGANGNAISFLMDYERLSFVEAVEAMAQSAGVEVPREQSSQQRADGQARAKTRRSLYLLMESVNSYYQRQLREHGQRKLAINYLARRGLNDETVQRFGIGFAPPGFDNVAPALPPGDDKQSLLLEAGILAEHRQRGPYDRFRQRIMFPIRDIRGRVIGFGGRALGSANPKYLNSPETSLFHKSNVLYGLYEARQDRRQPQRLLVVEGYMDVVSLAQFGIHSAVATLGTACGRQHLQLAFQSVSEIVFCFDGDRAGRQAARRAMENALPAMEDGRQIKFLYLPEGEDPDTLIRQIGADKFTRLIDDSAPLEDVLFDELSQHLNTQTMEGRARLCKLAAPLLNQLPRGVYRELCFNRLAQRTQLSMETLVALLDELPDRHPNNAVAVKPPSDNDTNYDEINHENDDPANYYEVDSYAVNDGQITGSGKIAASPPQWPQNSQQPSPPPMQGMRLNPGDLAVALLLYQPALVRHAADIDDLAHSNNASVKLLLALVDLLRQRPEFSSGQILGHWQGIYGAEATAALQVLMGQVALFHQARELSTKDPLHPFDPSQEFIDALYHLKKYSQQQNYHKVIHQLNQKPLSDWSHADKQLYRKATRLLNH